MQQNKHGLTAAKAGNRAKRDPLSSSACPKARVPHPLQPHRKGWERISLPIALALLFLTPALTQAQWDIQDSHTTASLRGIANVGGGVAWASGTDGTVLRTEDGGYLWQGCATPPGAEKLDFRGIQAFDENTAIVMSSGKGDLSRLYKTTDGCRTWKLLFINPDKEGFWDGIKFQDRHFGVLMGDPVGGKLYARYTANGGIKWQSFGNDDYLKVTASSGIFAASNSSIAMPSNPSFFFAIANLNNHPVFLEASFGELPCPYFDHKTAQRCPKDYGWWAFESLPIERAGESSGVFSFAIKTPNEDGPIVVVVAVGGDYLKPNSQGGAAYGVTDDSPGDEGSAGHDWASAQTPPHGYRSAVAYDPTTKTWITVGPNGTDISRDDGKNWSPLKPTASEPPDADKNWNALSLPFVVGPHGRIGKLRGDALKP